MVGEGASAVQLPSAAELEKMDYEYEEYDDEYDDDERMVLIRSTIVPCVVFLAVEIDME